MIPSFYKSNTFQHITLYHHSLDIIRVTSDSRNMGTSDLPDIYARRPRASADISGKSRVRMLQLLYDTPSSTVFSEILHLMKRHALMRAH